MLDNAAPSSQKTLYASTQSGGTVPLKWNHLSLIITRKSLWAPLISCAQVYPYSWRPFMYWRSSSNESTVISKRNTKQAIVHLPLSIVGWPSAEEHGMVKGKRPRAHQMRIVPINSENAFCVYTDASQQIWSGSWHPSGTRTCIRGISVNDLIRCAFFRSVEQLKTGGVNPVKGVVCSWENDWTTSSYTLHFSLIVLLFNALCIFPNILPSLLHQLLRWTLEVSPYIYVCSPIALTDSVWAQLLGRWLTSGGLQGLVTVPELPSSASPDFDWPSIKPAAQTKSEYD